VTKKRLSAKCYNDKIKDHQTTLGSDVGLLEWNASPELFGAIFMFLINKGIITHPHGKDIYHHSMPLGCIFTIKSTRFKGRNLKQTAVYELLKKARSAMNTEEHTIYQLIKNAVSKLKTILFLCAAIPGSIFLEFINL